VRRPGRPFAACASDLALVAVAASVGRDVARRTVSQELCRELVRDCRSAAGRDFPLAGAEPVRQVEPPLRDARQHRLVRRPPGAQPKDVQWPEPRLPDVPQRVGRQPEQWGARWQETVPQVQPDESVLPQALARPALPPVTQRRVPEQAPSAQRGLL
jgi:hypothetical protein